jgi:CubicO group peptidase (beta-lactamase class C family)
MQHIQMNRKTPWRGAMLTLAAMASSAIAGTPDGYAHVRQVIAKAVRSKSLPSVSAAVFSHGRIEWAEGFGWADREHRVRATPDTIYQLASISKSFTATALMSLVQQKKIDLNRPINDYLGAAKIVARVGHAEDATVLRVADHTSGLPFHVDFFYSNTPLRRPDAQTTIRKYGQLTNPPGDRYFYSNLGYGLLGDVVANQQGTDYATAMKDLVFQPLGLTSTFVGPPGRRTVAVQYQTNGARVPYFETDHAGASEVFSSANDLVRFAAFHLKAHLPGQRSILSDASIDRMHQLSSREDDTSGYGIGFEVSTRSGRQVVSHSGAMPGVATDMLLVPAEDLAIVVLCNAWSSEQVDEIVDQIAAVKLPGWRPQEAGGFPTPTRNFVPPGNLVGRWTGRVLRDEGALPVILDVRPDGKIAGTFGDQPTVDLANLSFKDGRLSGAFPTSLQTKDSERYSYVVYLDLKLDGERLFGAAVALDNPKSQTFVAGLSHWMDLHRVR